MKILYVITSLRTGGAEKLVVDLTKKLRSLGHQVDVALLDGYQTEFKKDLSQTGCKIYSLATGKGYYSGYGWAMYSPRRIFQLARIMKGYDIVHTHNSSPQFFAAMAHLFSSKPKLVTTEHNTTNSRRNKKWFLPLDRWMYNRYKTVICISRQAYSNLVSYLGRSKAQIKTILNGVDIDRLRNASAIDGFKSSSSVFAVTMVSAFRPQKDQATLLKAMALLPEEFELFLVGDGETRQQMEKLASDLGLGSRVHFTGNRNDVPQVLKSSDVIVMSSHYEGLSLSSIEGMAVGKPFVASDVDGLHEIVEGAGILVPHQDEKSLAEVLLRLREDTSYAGQVAASCMDRARQYDFSKMAEAYLEVYESLF